MLVGSVVACERCVTVTWTRRTSCVHPYLQDRYNELHSESHSSGDAKWAIVGVKGVCAAVSWACVRAYTHSFTRTFSSVVQLFFCLLACRINGSVDEAVSTQKTVEYTLLYTGCFKERHVSVCGWQHLVWICPYAGVAVMDCQPRLLWCLLCLNSSVLPEANFHVPAVRVTALPWQPHSCLRQSLNKKRCHVSLLLWQNSSSSDWPTNGQTAARMSVEKKSMTQLTWLPVLSHLFVKRGWLSFHGFVVALLSWLPLPMRLSPVSSGRLICQQDYTKNCFTDLR